MVREEEFSNVRRNIEDFCKEADGEFDFSRGSAVCILDEERNEFIRASKKDNNVAMAAAQSGRVSVGWTEVKSVQREKGGNVLRLDGDGVTVRVHKKDINFLPKILGD